MAWIVIVNGNNLITKQELKELIVSEIQAAVDAVTAKLTKVLGEVTSATGALKDEIEALKAQITEGQAPDLSGLEAVAQSLDELNEDAPESVQQPAE